MLPAAAATRQAAPLRPRPAGARECVRLMARVAAVAIQLFQAALSEEGTDEEEAEADPHLEWLRVARVAALTAQFLS